MSRPFANQADMLSRCVFPGGGGRRTWHGRNMFFLVRYHALQIAARRAVRI